MPVYLLATLDTKGREAALIRDRLVSLGCDTRLVDTGCMGHAVTEPDVSRDQVYQAAGSSLEAVRSKADRGEAVRLAAQGAALLVSDAHNDGQLDGVLALGGSAGTTIGAAAMQALPLGVPKLIVSTLASGQVRQYVADKDIVMMNSVVDIAGINRISRQILSAAAAAMAGLVRYRQVDPNAGVPLQDKPLIAASMFGVTTPCVQHAREILEQAGYEVLVFHATGNGGEAMESLIADGLIAGVLDITTTELADQLVGGVLSAGPNRLTAAARAGVPQVVSVGATDMVNFCEPQSVPERFKQRRFYQHNPTVTLMRTTAEENEQLGCEIGRKVARSRGPAAIMLPEGGVSAIDARGQPFEDPQARQALFRGVRQSHGDVELIEIPHHINDAEFAEAAARKLIELMSSH